MIAQELVVGGLYWFAVAGFALTVAITLLAVVCLIATWLVVTIKRKFCL